MKAKVDKLDINKLTNVPNNLKPKINYLDVGMSKTVPVDLKKISDAVDNDIVKNTKSTQQRQK